MQFSAEIWRPPMTVRLRARFGRSAHVRVGRAQPRTPVETGFADFVASRRVMFRQKFQVRSAGVPRRTRPASLASTFAQFH
jgi:hypothetical protein